MIYHITLRLQKVKILVEPTVVMYRYLKLHNCFVYFDKNNLKIIINSVLKAL